MIYFFFSIRTIPCLCWGQGKTNSLFDRQSGGGGGGYFEKEKRDIREGGDKISKFPFFGVTSFMDAP